MKLIDGIDSAYSPKIYRNKPAALLA